MLGSWGGVRRGGVCLWLEQNPFGIGLEDFRAGVAPLRHLAEAAGRPIPTVAAHLRLWIGKGSQRDAHVAGSVETVTAVLEEYRGAGLEYLICDFVADDGWDTA
jgi:hypothetical protein